MYPYNIRTSEDVTPVRTAPPPPPPPATPSLQTTPTEEGLDLSQNKDVNEILQLIIMAMTDEQRDGDFYNELSKNSISHIALSIKAAKTPSSFNKNFNSYEQ